MTTTRKRHSAQVTAERLAHALREWPRQLTAEEVDAIRLVHQAMDRIATRALKNGSAELP